MFLEAQFGPNMTPIETPRLTVKKLSTEDGMKVEEHDQTLTELEEEELERLHSIGVPVPGIEIKVDKYVAKVWLETLDVECASAVFRDRVKAVVDTAVETVSPLWAKQQMHHPKKDVV
jgi:cleavage and polyadenylation specificity factor subunit 3